MSKVQKVQIDDSEDAFAASAARPLLMMALFAVLGLVALMWGLQVLAGLVGSNTGIASAVDHENNMITLALRDEPPQLSSMKATDAISGMVLGHVMEGLLRMDMQDRLEPAIAERWEVTPERATFWLRDNAKWSDGEPVTAHDFEFAWKTVLDPENASRYAFLLYPIKNARKITEGEVPVEQAGVRAIDDRTLVVDLEYPTPFFDKLVTFQTYLPAREDFYVSTNGKYGADADKLLYTGPFRMTDWVHGSSLYMVKNEHYWDKERINLDAINFAYMTSDSGARVNFFSDNKIAYTTLRAEDLYRAMQNKWKIYRVQDGTLWYVEFNHRDDRITRNKNFRKALQLVLDMEELVYKVTKSPGYIPGESLFPGWLMGENDYLRKEYPAKKVRLDTATAQEHLRMALVELGLDEIPELVVLCDDSPLASTQAEWVQGTLKSKLGIDVKIDKQIFKQRLEKSLAGEFDILLPGWGPDYDDPLTFGDLFASWNVQNRGRFANEEYDAQVEIAQTSLDQGVRAAAFGRIQDIVFEEAAILPMYERGVSYVIHPDVKNVKRRVIGAEVDFTNAYLEESD
ncbi:MAG: peptide ABC transporter substrate-binding protein [Pseudomonadota bacterium]